MAGTGITSAMGDFCYETTTVILPGFLADRLGHVPVLVAGYVLGGVLTAALTACAFLFHVESVALLTVIFFIAGLYVAVQEALESTVTAEMVDKDVLAMSIGALGTVNGTAKFVSSSLVGVLWTVVSPVFGVTLAAVFMVVGTLFLLLVSKKA